MKKKRGHNNRHRKESKDDAAVSGNTFSPSPPITLREWRRGGEYPPGGPHQRGWATGRGSSLGYHPLGGRTPGRGIGEGVPYHHPPGSGVPPEWVPLPRAPPLPQAEGHVTPHSASSRRRSAAPVSYKQTWLRRTCVAVSSRRKTLIVPLTRGS